MLNNKTIVLQVLDELLLANDKGDTIGMNESSDSDSDLNSVNDHVPTDTICSSTTVVTVTYQTSRSCV